MKPKRVTNYRLPNRVSYEVHKYAMDSRTAEDPLVIKYKQLLDHCVELQNFNWREWNEDRNIAIEKSNKDLNRVIVQLIGKSVASACIQRAIYERKMK